MTQDSARLRPEQGHHIYDGIYIGHQLEIWLPVHKSMEILLFFDYIQLGTREQVGVVTTSSIRLSLFYNHFAVVQTKKILCATKQEDKNVCFYSVANSEQ